VTFADVAAPSEEIIAEARQGRMFILVDNEDRENEGDLIIPAEKATADAINFMAKYARGLICLAMEAQRVEDLGLPLMPSRNQSRFETAFTVSIEAKEGVTTGISAYDRAHTVATAINPALGKTDIVTPGHVFPLRAREGGVLVRAGHTEAATDIARLAGLNPSGVICEIMNDDGSMARRPDLIHFAQKHGLKIGTIADLIAYRRRHDQIITRKTQASFKSKFGGEWTLFVYANKVAYAEHIALVKGDVSGPGPVPVRMHAINLLDDMLGDLASGKAGELQSAMAEIEKEGRGVVVLLREPHATSLSERVTVLAGKDQEKSPSPPSGGSLLRDYGVGAQILIDLGLRDLILLSNTQHTIVGLEGHGLTIVGQRPIPPL